MPDWEGVDLNAERGRGTPRIPLRIGRLRGIIGPRGHDSPVLRKEPGDGEGTLMAVVPAFRASAR